MQSSDVLSKVDGIIKEVLGHPDVTISPETTAQDVPDWDSLSHIEIVCAIEQGFNVKFTAREIQSFRNVGQICSTVAQKQSR